MLDIEVDKSTEFLYIVQPSELLSDGGGLLVQISSFLYERVLKFLSRFGKKPYMDVKGQNV